MARQLELPLVNSLHMKHPDFGELIRTYRQKKGWTQLELSKALGYETAQFVSLIETNNSKCPMKVLGQVIVLLGIPEEDILEALKQSYMKCVQDEINSGKKLANSMKREKKAK